MKNKGKKLKTKIKPAQPTDTTEGEQALTERAKRLQKDKERFLNVDTEDANLKLFCVELLNDTENFRVEDEEENTNYYSLGGDNNLIRPEDLI